MIDIQEVTPSQVVRAYKGRTGCMCGCGGKYYCRPEHFEAICTSHGYRLDEGTINTAAVTEVLRTLQAEAARGTELEVDEEGEWVSLDLGKRRFTVFFRA